MAVFATVAMITSCGKSGSNFDIDVKDDGVFGKLPVITAEYKDQGFSSIAFAAPPFQSVMCLNLAINKLNGVEIAPTYQLNIPSITDDMIDRLYDSDLSDSFWVFSTLSEDQVKELFAE